MTETDEELRQKILEEVAKVTKYIEELTNRGYEVSVHCFTRKNERPSFSCTCKKELK